MRLLLIKKENKEDESSDEDVKMCKVVRIVSRWVNQRKSELNSAWSLEIAITEY